MWRAAFVGVACRRGLPAGRSSRFSPGRGGTAEARHDKSSADAGRGDRARIAEGREDKPRRPLKAGSDS